ncbi:putative Late nodulin [Medicago truncatula]|uniref:Nodule Cysteine-Rich (NCR) secreted peptide n=1 Tax=Medicago truncatula TaxID=3880 RepID=A0A072V4N7_MEDTR|nr:Nodule Cysteine-Rich (NCR) secreted peptide [Medicago truncatula]RHN66065.1 putative Late nodulin [Medicago truncatula]
MVIILKFIYALIILFFIIFVATTEGVLPYITVSGDPIHCINAYDCPNVCVDFLISRCINNKCYCM